MICFRVFFSDGMRIDVHANNPDQARDARMVKSYMAKERVTVLKVKVCKEAKAS